MTEPRHMTETEFQEEGYLMEANRQFFHPLGLALCVFTDEAGRRNLGVLDDREDLEGWYYKEFTDEMHAKADNVWHKASNRYEARTAAIGSWIQPIEWKEND